MQKLTQRGKKLTRALLQVHFYRLKLQTGISLPRNRKINRNADLRPEKEERTRKQYSGISWDISYVSNGVPIFSDSL